METAVTEIPAAERISSLLRDQSFSNGLEQMSSMSRWALSSMGTMFVLKRISVMFRMADQHTPPPVPSSNTPTVNAPKGSSFPLPQG